MSTARELVAELMGSGMSRQQIANAIGRHNSLVYQVEAGKKPGHNLVDALDALRHGAPVEELPAPPRRAQRLRTAVRTGGPRWSAATVRTPRAVANGARSLGPTIRDAAATGRNLSITLHTRDGREIKIGNSGRGIDAQTFQNYLDDNEGDFLDAVMDYLADNDGGYFDGTGTVTGASVSTWGK